jgi:hypothetical protein
MKEWRRQRCLHVRITRHRLKASPAGSPNWRRRTLICDALTRPDGRIGWVLAKLTDMLDDPNVQAIVCNYADITARKERERIMAEFEALAASTRRAIFSKDRVDGRADAALGVDGLTPRPMEYLELWPPGL